MVLNRWSVQWQQATCIHLHRPQYRTAVRDSDESHIHIDDSTTGGQPLAESLTIYTNEFQADEPLEEDDGEYAEYREYIDTSEIHVSPARPYNYSQRGVFSRCEIFIEGHIL